MIHTALHLRRGDWRLGALSFAGSVYFGWVTMLVVVCHRPPSSWVFVTRCIYGLSPQSSSFGMSNANLNIDDRSVGAAGESVNSCAVSADQAGRLYRFEMRNVLALVVVGARRSTKLPITARTAAHDKHIWIFEAARAKLRSLLKSSGLLHWIAGSVWCRLATCSSKQCARSSEQWEPGLSRSAFPTLFAL